MLLRVIHETRYAYQPQVENAQHIAYLKPVDGPWQTLHRHRLVVAPQPAQQGEVQDVYGNVRSFFALQTPHETLAVVADSEVETRCPPAPRLEADGSLPWEEVRDQYRYRAGTASDGAAEYVFASPHVPHDEAFAAYARPSFTPGRPLLVAAHDLMRRIHADFTYATAATEVNTPALEALALRSGVCQDFAHIMIAGMRSLGLPARYVSGYLLTEPPPGQPRLIGSDASHAWMSVWSPACGGEDTGHWQDLDPTNDRAPGEDYVTLAVGRDYSDVSPMRGVIYGGSNHQLDVAVTVMPLDEMAADDGQETAED